MAITSRLLTNMCKVANPTPGQLNRENEYFLYSRSRLKIWSRETGSGVSFRVTLLHGIPPAFRGGVHLFIIPPSAIKSVPGL